MRRNAMSKMLLLAATALLTVGLLAGGCKAGGSNKKWPAKPVTLIVSQGTGGGTDTTVRALQPYLQKALGVAVMVENKPGSAGLTAANYVYDQPSDGYTILASHNGLLLSTQLTPDAFKPKKPLLDVLTPMYSWLSADGNAIIVKKDSPFKSVDDIAKAAQTKTLTVALAGGAGSTDHLTYLQFTKAYPGKYQFVPFDSAGEAVAAVLGGHTDFGLAGLAGGSVDLSRVTALAVTTEKRMDAAPDVKTFAELGHKELTLTFTVGAYVKADTPPEVKKALEAAFEKAFKDPGYQDWAKNSKKPIGEGWGSAKWTEYLKFFDGVVQKVLPDIKADMAKAQGK